MQSGNLNNSDKKDDLGLNSLGLMMKKPKYNSRSLAKYVNSLQQDSKEAYDIFRD